MPSIRWRNLLVALLFVVGAVATIHTQWGAWQQKQPLPKPNFVLILADDMGFSDLGFVGGGTHTPALDSLAQSGVVFREFYNTSRCWPTRASLMTGLYPHQAKSAMPWGKDAPSAYQGTSKAVAAMLPEALREHGYATIHVGKWHLDTLPGNQPLDRGFDVSYWTPTQDNYFNPKFVLDQRNKIDRPGHNRDYYVTDELGTKASGFLSDHLSSSKKPFFMYLAFTAPHFPLHAPKDTIDHFIPVARAGWDRIRQDRYEAIRKKKLANCTELSARDPLAGEWNTLDNESRERNVLRMATHLAMIAHMDRATGRVVDTLRAAGQLDNTVIMFLSDNGASAEQLIRGDGHDPAAPFGSTHTYQTLQVGWSNAANAPFKGHKIYTYEGGISTPLIVHWPSRLAKSSGQLNAQVGHVIDIAPTILDMAGIHPSALENKAAKQRLPGVSLLKALTHTTTEERLLFWEHAGNRALRKAQWKIVADYGQPFELYDLSVDRCETKDIAGAKPELLTELAALWQAEAVRQGVLPWSNFPSAQYTPSAEYRQK